MIDRPLGWVLPQAAFDHACRELAADGALDREGIAMWVGVARSNANGTWIQVTHVVLLRGPGLVRGMGYIGIAPELLNEVTDALATLGNEVYVVGQIHSHPPCASTDLSDVDIAYGIRTPHYLSLVAPNYAMNDVVRLADCGVHVFEPDIGWRRLDDAEIASRITVVALADADVTCLVVGADDHA